MKNKKSQSEAVGFIVIVLLVMIVGVIFLGISLRQDDSGVVTTDSEISNFLSAASSYTTSCAIEHEFDYRTLENLAGDCYKGKSCLNGKSSCDMLNSTYSDMLKNFRPGGTPLGYYKLTFSYAQNSSSSAEDRIKFGKEIIYGNGLGCVSKRAGEKGISFNDGEIVEILETCVAE